MKTQGISLVTSNVSDRTAVQTTKANDSTFESFMTNHASKVETSNAAKKTDLLSQKTGNDSVSDVEKVENVSNSNAAKKEKVENDVERNDKASIDSKNTEKKSDVQDEKDAVNLAMGVISFSEIIQTIFGMSAEQVQDVLDQAGIQVPDLFGDFIGPASMEDVMQQLQNALQNLVMNIHGITDKAAFVTNDTLNQEFEMLKEQVFALFSEMAENVQGMTMEQRMQPAVENPVLSDDAEIESGILTGSVKEAFEVIVETDTQSGESKDGSLPQQTEETASVRTETGPSHGADNAANVFVERLTEAFGTSRGEGAQEPMPVMSTIVEQVVRQVRIRVMPETTNMELMLHPASLGRVNLSVSTMANGVSTAVLTVENQMAKEALESQLIALKQSFDEQGLKVDAVEVTISDFGMNHENRDAYPEQHGGQSGNRRFRTDAGEERADETENDKETDETRRDVNSVVDYTA